MVERSLCMREVRGSIPRISTLFFFFFLLFSMFVNFVFVLFESIDLYRLVLLDFLLGVSRVTKNERCESETNLKLQPAKKTDPTSRLGLVLASLLHSSHSPSLSFSLSLSLSLCMELSLSPSSSLRIRHLNTQFKTPFPFHHTKIPTKPTTTKSHHSLLRLRFPSLSLYTHTISSIPASTTLHTRRNSIRVRFIFLNYFDFFVKIKNRE